MCHLSRTLSYILLISAIKNGKETNRPKLLLVSGIDVGPGKFGKRNKGPFKNYVDKILTIYDYLPTSTWTFFTLNVDKKKHFLATYPPHLVHVVFERPLNIVP